MSDDHSRAPGSPAAEETPAALLQVTSDVRNGAVVITAAGELDTYTADRLATAVRDGLQQYAPIMVIDVSQVTFFGSAAIALLVDADAATRDNGQQLRVVVGNQHMVIHTLTITGTIAHLSVFGRLEDALIATPDTAGDPVGGEPA